MTHTKFTNDNYSHWKKNTFDPNKKARGFVGHIRWSLHGKRKFRPFRGHMAWRLESDYRIRLLNRELGRVSWGYLWPRPSYEYRFWRGYESIWMPETKTNHKKV